MWGEGVRRVCGGTWADRDGKWVTRRLPPEGSKGRNGSESERTNQPVIFASRRRRRRFSDMGRTSCTRIPTRQPNDRRRVIDAFIPASPGQKTFLLHSATKFPYYVHFFILYPVEQQTLPGLLNFFVWSEKNYIEPERKNFNNNSVKNVLVNRLTIPISISYWQ